MEEIHKRKAEVKRSKQLNDQAEARRQKNRDTRRRREERINNKMNDLLKQLNDTDAAVEGKKVERVSESKGDEKKKESKSKK
jgi:large subunit ribosomal protein L19e